MLTILFQDTSLLNQKIPRQLLNVIFLLIQLLLY